MLKSIITAAAISLLLASGASATEFGAIAVSPSTGAYGYSQNFKNKREAQKTALRYCRKHARDCKIATTFWNACGALAMGDNGWGAHFGKSPQQAENKSVRMCNQYTRNCVVRTSVCSW